MRKLVRTLFAALAAFAAVVAAAPSNAEITININGGNVQPLPIAIPNFVGSGDTASIGALATVNDLSTGSPDLATAEDWTLGNRYRLTLSSASHFTGSGALVRVRARVRTALALP